ncbi:hypothetical protein H0B56_01340 [Haloechinothrix sp. YIM 98757]|uniref:Uncharacterized protein n=1 Tax=Haloechinothrix aidingensis TaxID=2752311 RepID=A0A838A7P3_9PSEU|nr:hypothetical protein [Haloechinothrix aidingensis]MBA0124182.1 hypothetical protein [Haloechinothrix aidingensis]
MNADPPGATRTPDRQVLRPRRYWYIVAAGLLVIGLVAGGALGWRANATYPSIEGQVASGETEPVELDRAGMTIYTDKAFLDGGCEVEDPDGQEVPLDPVASTETVTFDDTAWQVVLRSSTSVPAGEYAVSCSSDSDAVFGVGPDASVFTAEALVFGAVGSAGLGAFLAGMTTLLVFLRRRAARRASEADTANGSGGEPDGDDGAGLGQYGSPPDP